MEDWGCRFLILECLIVNERELKERAKRFGLRMMKLVDVLPNTMAG